ncbi:MAG: Hsp20/alpha crystallin family protein [Chitinophagaceae bacterium]|nr:Hsp20/alpha crystallin family protein [Chitinophagaceae bacterium]
MVKLNNRPVAKNIDNLFDELLNNFPGVWGNTWKDENANFPAMNIHETAEAFHLEVNAPGRTKEDFTINLENGLLSIGFEQKKETENVDYKTLRREFTFRSFKRSFQVDDSIDSEKIQARYENGILKLLLPKKEQVKINNKQITIQ